MTRENITDEVVENRRRISNIQGANLDNINEEDVKNFDFSNESITGKTDLLIKYNGNQVESKNNVIGTQLFRKLIIDILSGTTDGVSKHIAGSGDQTDTTARRDVTSVESALDLSLSHSKSKDSNGDTLILESSTDITKRKANKISEIAIKTKTGNVIQYIPVDVTV